MTGFINRSVSKNGKNSELKDGESLIYFQVLVPPKNPFLVISQRYIRGLQKSVSKTKVLAPLAKPLFL